ncbi:MAG: hypothetical protein DMF63_11030 [Acidobacteria bacterium]|nr:MAG: hypothetical protein DMF63_11030 [Acidobacteriota bacterium]
MHRTLTLTLVLFFTVAAFAQNETIDNKTVVEMSKAGLSSELIVRKIGTSHATFDVSASALIVLKKADVDDSVIAAMIERSEIAIAPAPGFSESGPPPVATPEHVMNSAKTIAFGKSSLQPSRQALEKELMKRKDFQGLHLTIERYKDSADLFVDIGFVPFSWITHRYVYRIYDRRTGAVLAAGETTSWGSLAENLARHITKSLMASRSGT